MPVRSSRVRAAMLLAVDVGNTNVTLALFDGERLAADWRLTSRHEWTADEVAVELRQLFELRGFELGIVTGVVISSVVPTINPALVEASRRYLKCEPVMVGPGVKTSVRIRYDNPKDVGADRIANALAAYSKYGGPIVVIDFGTAVTYDAINAEGDYLGGAIAPGVEISLDALVSHTAMLRRVEPVAPDSVIGRNTVASIQSGLVWGFVAQVEGMVKRMVDELGGQARVIATGGQASLVADLTHVIEVTDPLLTLEGLRLIYAQNSDGGARSEAAHENRPPVSPLRAGRRRAGRAQRDRPRDGTFARSSQDRAAGADPAGSRAKGASGAGGDLRRRALGRARLGGARDRAGRHGERCSPAAGDPARERGSPSASPVPGAQPDRDRPVR